MGAGRVMVRTVTGESMGGLFRWWCGYLGVLWVWYGYAVRVNILVFIGCFLVWLEPLIL